MIPQQTNEIEASSAAFPGKHTLMVDAWLEPSSVRVRFADGRESIVPMADIMKRHRRLPTAVALDSPYQLTVRFGRGAHIFPWDWVRMYGDPAFVERAIREDRRSLAWLGKRLHALRVSASFTQESLAEASGIARSTIARLEAGKHDPGFATLEKIARPLGISLAEILG